jgi:predicted DNA-binding transcriptional regulator
MPENLEKFTSPDQSKKTGKLTPEEIKEMVEKYKEEHEGLLPEYFSLPGEEKEEEREYPEELLIYYQLKEKLKPIEQGLKNETLIKNMFKWVFSHIQGKEAGLSTFFGYFHLFSFPKFQEIKERYPKEIQKIEQGLKNETLRKNAIKETLSYIQNGKKKIRDAWLGFISYFSLFFYSKFKEIKEKYPKEIQKIEQGLKNETLIKNMIEYILFTIRQGRGGDWAYAMEAFNSYASLLNCPNYREIKQKYPKEIQKIEESLKNETLVKNAIEGIIFYIKEGQKQEKDLRIYSSAYDAFVSYSYLLSYLSHLYKIGQKKLAEIESQKAMHPEKKLPPMPEEKAF